MQTGLTPAEVEAKRSQFGTNTIPERSKKSGFGIFLNQVKSPLIYILILAAGISFLLGEEIDAFFILIVVVINTVLGFNQEYKAESILQDLKHRITKNVKVIREGKHVVIPAEELVPGDILLIQPGLRVPADGKILESEYMVIDESLLTGESEPIMKAVKDEVFMGTSVLEGLGTVEISRIGITTQFGKIAKNLSSEEETVTPLKKELLTLSRNITIAVLVIIVFIFLIGLVNGFTFQNVFVTAVAIGVGLIPEGLLISVTITLALGMSRILQKKGVLKNLLAAETLGSVNVLCIDKTGTLTFGQMKVESTDFTNEEEAIQALMLCNNRANFIDIALENYLNELKGPEVFEDVQRQKLKLLPFSSSRKYSAALSDNGTYVVGAPEILLDFCDGDLAGWTQKIQTAAKEGKRMVGVAYTKQLAGGTSLSHENLKNMEFLGLAYLKDPVRISAIESLQKVINAGIEIKVITGDLRDTSLSVLHSLNFKVDDAETVSGQELKDTKTQQKLDQLVKTAKLFYRMTPEQKLIIVESLQRQGKRVGMMGDGVNDSPALKKAEIGICVDNATDVSKEVADLILLDSNFQTIVDAVEEGRTIFKNLKKIMVYLFADNFLETVLILLSLILKLPLPLLPLQLLWINIIEDGLPSLALSFEKANEKILLEKPSNKRRSVFDLKLIGPVFLGTLFADVLYFSLFYYAFNIGMQLDHIQTMIFAGVSLSSLLFLFSAKTIESNIWKEKIFDNRIANFSVVLGVVLLLLAIYFPPLQYILKTVNLSLAELGIVSVISVFHICLIELVKYLSYKRNKN